MRRMPAITDEREQPLVDSAEANDTVLIYAAGFEGRELKTARSKVMANARFAHLVLPPESKADRTD